MALNRLTGTGTPTDRIPFVSGDDPVVVHVVEPVYVDPEALEVTLDDLADVSAPLTVPLNVPLALQRGADGTYSVVELPEPETPATAYRHDQLAATTLWQVHHSLGFRPAGVLVTDYDGTLIEPDKITHPLPDYVEITFGVPVAGIAWLS